MIFFSSNLKFLREREGIKQADLAQRIGVKANTISNYEKGVSQPDYSVLQLILNVFNIDADSLLYKNISENNTSRILNSDYLEENTSVTDKLLYRIDEKEAKIESQAEQIGALKQTIRQLEERIEGLQQSILPNAVSAGSTRIRKSGAVGQEDAQFAEW
nr:MAG TPA: Repressor protein CI [Caudoviricetes sp.]